MRRFRIVGFVFLGSSVLILFPASTIDCVADTLPEGLPSWFKALDKDRDGQITLSEWRAGGKRLAEFRRYDLNGDGLLTPAEVLRVTRRPIELNLENGQSSYTGAIAATDGKHQGRKLAKVFAVTLEAGKTYQFDHKSRAFDAFLYLEDADGAILAQDDDGGGGTDAHIVHRAANTGTYRLIATSLGGGGRGAFSLSVRVLGGRGGAAPEGFPPAFKALDKNRDGQITLAEWRAGGKSLAEFRRYDLNGDGLLTPEEVLRVTRRPIELNLENGRANYTGAIEATDGKQQGEKLSKVFAVTLEAGRIYQIEHVSQAFFAYLYLEDPNGKILDKNNSGGRGRTSRIVHHAAHTGTYRLIATSQGGGGLGAFSLSVRVLGGRGGDVPQGLPLAFKDLDMDRDGQISLREWRAGGKDLAEFRQFDLNGDGFLTPDEVLRIVKKVTHLEFENGQANYDGAIEEATDETYLGKKTFKILTVTLEAGKTYQIEHVSQVFFAYLYLEDPNGEILDKNNSGGRGRISRIVHRAAHTGTYRLIATSQDGYKAGAFSLSVRVLGGRGGDAPEGFPPAFKALDADRDGQITLSEWRAGGKDLAEFHKYDRNGDGLLTPAEVLRVTRKPIELILEHGRANYTGAIAATDRRHQGRKLAKVFAVTLEAGKAYQFDHKSRAFDAFLYLEDADGAVLAQDDDGGGGTDARIVHRAANTGTYRLIATSLGGGGRGAFSLSVRVLGGRGGNAPQGLPPALKALDTDQDGQISLREWRKGGKRLGEFRNYDRNGDGLITAEEVLRNGKKDAKKDVKKAIHPKGLPPWFKDLDTDQDGQISLREWRKGGKRLGEFRNYDLNHDGFITAEEVLRDMQRRSNRPNK